MKGEIKTEIIYSLTGNEMKLIDLVRKRLYSERTMNADDMRDLAHKLTCVMDAAWNDDQEIIEKLKKKVDELRKQQ